MKIKVPCRRCGGRGEYETVEDCHRSAGIVPCYRCDSEGKETIEVPDPKPQWDTPAVKERR